MEWWGELVGILERRAGPVMHALTFVELNGINLAPLLRRFTSLTLLSTPTSLILYAFSSIHSCHLLVICFCILYYSLLLLLLIL
jgi:hypothetical protein